MNERLTIFDKEKLTLVVFNGTYDYAAVSAKGVSLAEIIVSSGLTKCILDFRETNFSFDHFLVEDIYRLILMNNPALKKVKTVFLTSSPQTTIYVLLFKQQIEKKNGSVIQCTTLDYAIKVLGLFPIKESIEASYYLSVK